MLKFQNKRVVLSVSNDLNADQRMHKICTSLLKQGFHVMLVGRKLPQSQNLTERTYILKRLNLFFNTGFLFYAEFNLKLFRFLIKQKPKLLVANDLDTITAVFFASLICRIPFVYDSHEYFTEVPELKKRRFVQLFWLTIEKLFIRKAIKSYTVCDSIARIYHQKYGIQMDVIRNLPYTAESSVFKTPQLYPADKKIILYQGAVNVGRGVEQVIRAMQWVEDSVFIIIGNGDKLLEIKRLTKDLFLDNKVLFMGQIPFQSLAPFTANAHLGISLEQNIGLNYYYSLPNKLFDYIGANIPVLVSAFPEIRKIVENYQIGLITDNYEPKYLAKMINFMLFDEESRSLWKTNLIKASKELVWEKEEVKLFEIYDSFKTKL